MSSTTCPHCNEYCYDEDSTVIHIANCSTRLRAENDRLQPELQALREAAQIVVDRMRGSGGINPDAADALLELAALSKENSDE